MTRHLPLVLVIACALAAGLLYLAGRQAEATVAAGAVAVGEAARRKRTRAADVRRERVEAADRAAAARKAERDAEATQAAVSRAQSVADADDRRAALQRLADEAARKRGGR